MITLLYNQDKKTTFGVIFAAFTQLSEMFHLRHYFFFDLLRTLSVNARKTENSQQSNDY